MKFNVFAIATIAFLMFALPAIAHHSFAMFDASKTVTLEGTVKEFHWTNPHSWIFLNVADGEGRQEVETEEKNQVNPARPEPEAEQPAGV